MSVATLVFIAQNANDALAKLQTIKTTAVEIRTFPMPTNGETIPPKRKAVKPIIAEAFPAVFLSSDNANVEEAGLIMPMNSKIKKNIASIM